MRGRRQIFSGCRIQSHRYEVTIYTIHNLNRPQNHPTTPRSKKTQDSTVPSTRNPQVAPARVAEESPHLHHEIRSPLEGNRAEVFAGDYSPVQGENLPENLSNFDGGIDEGAFSSKSAGAPAKKFEQDQRIDIRMETPKNISQQHSSQQ
uniref:Uncharacterized protein n=1 Tax=Solanum tuberosum TaxID=4113 RepID=M1DWS6_SOLTU